MRLTQRHSVILVLGVQFAGTVLLLLYYLLSGSTVILPIVLGSVLYAALLAAYWRGWEYARHAAVLLVTLLAGFGMPNPMSDTFNPGVFVAPALALVMLGPAWVVGSAATVMTILIVRSGGVGAYASPTLLLVMAMVVGAMVLARLVMNSALRESQASTRTAEAALRAAEAQAAALAQANRAQEEQLAQQQQLLELVATLETPAVQLADGVLFAPVVGHLDTRRSQALTGRLLDAAHAQRATLVVLDIAGVSAVDTAVARALLQTAQALRLLGCRVAISGISTTVAATLVTLGVDLSEVITVRSPQEALDRHVS